jgi:hypothetical protein
MEEGVSATYGVGAFCRAALAAPVGFRGGAARLEEEAGLARARLEGGGEDLGGAAGSGGGGIMELQMRR